MLLSLNIHFLVVLRLALDTTLPLTGGLGFDPRLKPGFGVPAGVPTGVPKAPGVPPPAAEMEEKELCYGCLI